ncbi:VOC family protein [Streptomyces sp. DH18]|uniref:VOC family protein n=1 Tax=Streptomyces sp. DH18 TaxID=3040126 RepID=UPI0024417478|nr:VOC family protein [Streptomyces sp. DH18]MDG9684341.1 VOC family protein [Streptomyces sp. DH18]
MPVQGAPCWVNLMVADLAVAQAFYGAVLGWRFRSSSLDEEFVVATAGGDAVAGIGTRRPGLAPASEWTPYFAVRDADATAARIRERGATVAVGPMALGDGRVGLAADRDGATFGFWEGYTLAWSPGEGRTPVRLDLQTAMSSRPRCSTGKSWWTAEDFEVAYRNDHVLVKLGGQVVLSLRGGGVQTSPFAHLRPRWLVNFAVDDIETAVTAAVAAGGSKPQPSSAARAPRGFSRTLQDPDGGLFTLTLTHQEP